MTDSVVIHHADLCELDENSGQPKESTRVRVQFNPETLKVSYANQVVPPTNTETPQPKKAQDQNGSSTMQFVGKGTTKLAVQVWFDVTAPLPDGKESVTDVRELTKDVVYFITPHKQGDKMVPPAVRFRWGSFHFDGIVDALEESLEFFSSDGVPLRASIGLSLSQQGIQFAPPPPSTASDGAAAPGSGTPGTRPMTSAVAGQSLQNLAAGLGLSSNWQTIANANNIDNPRLLTPGQLIDMLE